MGEVEKVLFACFDEVLALLLGQQNFHTLLADFLLLHFLF